MSMPRLVALFLSAALLGGCATAPESMANNDPFEKSNRAVFAFNQGFDDHLGLPVAKAYRSGLPETARTGIRNVLDNLDEPLTFANDLLRGHLSDGGETLGRFGVNSTIGIVGLLDVASELGMEKHRSEFGGTLAGYGVGEGPYFILPVLGPAPARDFAGRVADIFLDPFSVAGFAATIGRDSARAIDDRERNIETVQDIQELSVDAYARVRSLYRQHRNMEIYGLARTTEDLPDF